MADESTPTELGWYVNALGEDVQHAAWSKTVATGLVGGFVGGLDSNPFGVPVAILEMAVLEVGADVYYRKASRNGVVGLDGVDPQPFRLNRDPMAAAYPLLRRFLVVGI